MHSILFITSNNGLVGERHQWCEAIHSISLSLYCQRVSARDSSDRLTNSVSSNHEWYWLSFDSVRTKWLNSDWVFCSSTRVRSVNFRSQRCQPISLCIGSVVYLDRFSSVYIDDGRTAITFELLWRFPRRLSIHFSFSLSDEFWKVSSVMICVFQRQTRHH